MDTRRLGQSELRLSVIGFGTAAMGRDPRGWGPMDDNESIAAIHAALALGINWIETAPWHGAGHAEEVVGRALQGRRESALIVGCLETPSADALGARRESVSKAVARDMEASLRRLRTDHLDVCLCRVSDGTAILAETVGCLSTLLSHGTIRAMGVLPAQPERMDVWRAAGALHATMGAANLLETQTLRHAAPYAVLHGVGLLACSPLCRGLLSGGVTAASRFADLRARDAQFLSPRLVVNLEAIESLRVMAVRRERPLVQLALSWLLGQPGVTAAAVGVKRPSQMRDLADAVWPLAPHEVAEIDAVLAAREERLAQAR